jgi:hypothetical protein
MLGHLTVMTHNIVTICIHFHGEDDRWLAATSQHDSKTTQGGNQMMNDVYHHLLCFIFS